eukprot:CAMPEP_0181232916 /NCGR_PEP_ID=MMETSP1096-20121128/36023_1 /TAXON_ID=156174 ORGANISM="Chrysochromulina ericina, Strain CCMP281" /NCGR_SAMPLE_ID=MMETSP1096 /ASSEMBLY_ACC=CAM_ASM_000453 /LENGTH=54 /DNA_ID=CAMNT_0023327313 /DNA_START=396 /DNA_END=557 /DNA_ORIENTATION=+
MPHGDKVRPVNRYSWGPSTDDGVRRDAEYATQAAIRCDVVAHEPRAARGAAKLE